MKDRNKGKIISVKGQIVEVKFPKDKPAINDLLILEGESDVRLEVYSSSGPDTFYCLGLSRTNSLYRGAKVVNTSSPIMFPVGNQLLGRVVDIFGRPIDQGDEMKIDQTVPIHRKSSLRTKIVTKQQQLETGIKVIDIFTPLIHGGKMGLFGGAGVGKTIGLEKVLSYMRL
jgi:F-type H+-transporting ATPase subunit beta